MTKCKWCETEMLPLGREQWGAGVRYHCPKSPFGYHVAAPAEACAVPETGEAANRQHRVRRWVTAVLGPDHMAPKVRALRFLEEAHELAQALGVQQSEAALIQQHVYDKPRGNIEQEVGGCGTTLLGCAESLGLSFDVATEKELSRIEALPPEKFRKREALNASLGIGRAPEARAPHEPQNDPLCANCGHEESSHHCETGHACGVATAEDGQNFVECDCEDFEDAAREQVQRDADHEEEERFDAREIGRWQHAIYLLLVSQTDDSIDGGGCDSGDPLDFTLAEIGQALAILKERAASLERALRDLGALVARMNPQCSDPAFVDATALLMDIDRQGASPDPVAAPDNVVSTPQVQNASESK